MKDPLREEDLPLEWVAPFGGGPHIVKGENAACLLVLAP